MAPGTDQVAGESISSAIAMDQYLPLTVLATILSKLDIPSLVSASATSRTLHACVRQTLSFLPTFHLLEIPLKVHFLRHLLPPNPSLRTMRLDCSQLEDDAIPYLVRPSLNELCLLNCQNLSGRILSELGTNCHDLKTLSLNSVSERRGVAISLADLEELLNGCSNLECLSLVINVSIFDATKFSEVWSFASPKLNSLEIGYIPRTMSLDLLTAILDSQNPQLEITKTPFFPSLIKLCLSVDCITDHLIESISNTLPSLVHLDLQDSPICEPTPFLDLTNTGFQQINKRGKLTHISLVRSHEFMFTSFKRINDLGLLVLADTCSKLESICFAGFSRVTDAGFRAIIHSCSSLKKLRVSYGTQLTDLVFHDITATSLSLTHVSLRWCNHLTNTGITKLSFNKDLNVLDLRDCRNLSDEALMALSNLNKLQVLLLDGTGISDLGISYLGNGTNPLITLSLRSCKKLTNNCIPLLLTDSIKKTLQHLDLSRVNNITDEAIISLAQTRVPITELRLRECTRIGNPSITRLALMSSLQVLDMFECGGITALAFRWLKKPYFARLRWLGLTGIMNRDIVDALARSRPFLRVAGRGEELGTVFWGRCEDWYRHEDEDEDEDEDMDELDQWLFGINGDHGDHDDFDDDEDEEVEVEEGYLEN